MVYFGNITDATDETSPVQGATVTLAARGRILARAAADGNGFFSINTVEPAETITITSVGYKANTFPASPYQRRFELERAEVYLPPAVVYADPYNVPPMPPQRPAWGILGGLAAGLLLILLMRDK